MRLEQNQPGGRVYQGPGRVDQDAKHQLQFTLYAVDAPFPELKHLPAGSLIPPDHYWTLTATDDWGTEWRGTHVLVNPGWSGFAQGSVISAQLPMLEAFETLDRAVEGGRFEGHIFRDLRLPANRKTVTRMDRDVEWSQAGSLDTVVTDVGDIHFLLHQGEAQLRVSATNRTAQPHAHFAERVREALQFVAAYPVSWAVTIEVSELKRRVYIRGRPSPQIQPGIQPPIQRNMVSAEKETWRLFGDYFAYVCKDKTSEVHPLSADWNAVLLSSIVSVEAEALAASIAVESTCRHLDEHRRGKRHVDAPTLMDWGQKVDEFLSGLGCPERTRRRVQGFFSRMGVRDHTDLLRELASKGAVDASLVEAWSRWRPIMAHGDREAQRELGALHAACDAMETLLYQLYFYAVGYEGLYCHLAAPGWPPRLYPPATAIETRVNS